MSILELIKNEEVEWKKLGEVCEVRRGKGLKKENKGTGEIKAILYGELYTTYVDYIYDIKTKIDENLCSNSVLIPKNSILMPISSTTKEAQIGKASVLKIENVYLGSDAISLYPQKNILSDYLMYVLNSKFFENKKMKNVSGTTIRHLSVNGILDILIPIPTLATQQKIVEILDKFTKCVTELQSELQSRVKQYEYYRDMLLSEDYLNKMELGELKLRQITLGEIGKISMCKRILKNQTKSDGDIPFYKIGTFGKKADAYITKELFEEYKNKYSYPKKGEILISASGTIGRTVIYNGENAYFQDSNIVWLSNDESKVLNKYLYYFYNTNPWSISEGGTISRIYNGDIEKIKIVLPPLKLQNTIVTILDKFQEYVSDVSGLLPEEIELRQKEYEFYREKLLTFDENVVTHTHTHTHTHTT